MHPARHTVGCAAALVAGVLATPAFVHAQIAFTDVSQVSGVGRSGESYGASWGDLNGDGYLDLYASNHRQRDSLFLNLGNGRFVETGAQVLTWRNRSRADTHGGSWADFDNDGDQDLLVSAGTGNLSELLVNERQRLVDRTRARGLTATNVGGRLPVWLDYDGDRLLDFVMTQFGGIAKLYRQGPPGQFSETTSAAKLLCVRFHYAQLVDVNGDGRLDFMCADEASFPQRIYDTRPLPWQKLYDKANPASFLPPVPQSVDSVVADFDNDGRMDLFVLGGVQLRPSGVTQSSPTHFEAGLMNGIKGFRFVTSGRVRFDMDWNKQDTRTTTDFRRIRIGAGSVKPTQLPFTLDPANAAVRGMPPPPTQRSQLPVMDIGYEPAMRRWTLVLWTQLSDTGSLGVFSEAYVMVDTTEPLSALAATGLWPSDRPQRPRLLMNHSGGFVDQTARANLDVPLECVSATAGDFDNDMDVDLYLACRRPAANIANVLFANRGDGTFQRVNGAGGAAGPVGIAVRGRAGTADSTIAGDYDADGFLDLFVTNGFNLRPLGTGGPNKLFRNRGNGKRWLQLDLVGTRSDRDATGARAWVTAGGVRQLREQNGAYHRWSQDMKRLHFGLGSATTATLRVEWPGGTVQDFSNVATNRMYRLTEGGSLVTVRPGGAPPYQCGAPRLNPAVDRGVFIWQDCPSGEWRMKTLAGGGTATHAGTILSNEPWSSVKGIALNTGDRLDYRTDPKKIVFRFVSQGTSQEGVNFVAQDGASECLRVHTPSGTRVHYGPFRRLLATPLDLETRGACR